PFCTTRGIFITAPLPGGNVSCVDPKRQRPTLFWTSTVYERFQVQISTDPNFSQGTVINASKFVSSSSFTIPGKKWVAACARAFQNQGQPGLYLRVHGKDLDAVKTDPARYADSQVVQVFPSL